MIRRALMVGSSLLLASCHLLLSNGPPGERPSEAGRGDRAVEAAARAEGMLLFDGARPLDGPRPDLQGESRSRDSSTAACPPGCLLGCDTDGGTCRGTLSTVSFASLPPVCPTVSFVATSHVVDTTTCKGPLESQCPGSMQLVLVPANGSSYCVVHVGTITIAASAVVTVTGDWPLVVVADGDVIIDGTLEVEAGGGAGGATCADGNGLGAGKKGISGGAGGGGAGGAANGGAGGGASGGSGGPPGTAYLSSAGPLRGGSGGGGGCMWSVSCGVTPDGQGGRGGGAIQISSAQKIVVQGSGEVLARGRGGHGGSCGGGGGGGSGGTILLESPQLLGTGMLAATGGAGGGGGQAGPAGPGQDGPMAAVAAQGGAGTGTATGGGAGGVNGGAGYPAALSVIAAGGGGGAGGRVRLRYRGSASVVTGLQIFGALAKEAL